jgi:hypothetical protein
VAKGLVNGWGFFLFALAKHKQQNINLVNSTYSGLDMTNYPNLFFFENGAFSFEEVKGLSLCVASCPNDDVTCTNVNDPVLADCPGFPICLNDGPYGPVVDHPDIAATDAAHICPDATYALLPSPQRINSRQLFFCLFRPLMATDTLRLICWVSVAGAYRSPRR